MTEATPSEFDLDAFVSHEARAEHVTAFLYILA